MNATSRRSPLSFWSTPRLSNPPTTSTPWGSSPGFAPRLGTGWHRRSSGNRTPGTGCRGNPGCRRCRTRSALWGVCGRCVGATSAASCTSCCLRTPQNTTTTTNWRPCFRTSFVRQLNRTSNLKRMSTVNQHLNKKSSVSGEYSQDITDVT